MLGRKAATQSIRVTPCKYPPLILCCNCGSNELGCGGGLTGDSDTKRGNTHELPLISRALTVLLMIFA